MRNDYLATRSLSARWPPIRRKAAYRGTKWFDFCSINAPCFSWSRRERTKFFHEKKKFSRGNNRSLRRAFIRRTRYGWTENERIAKDDYTSNETPLRKPFSVCRETVRHRAAMIVADDPCESLRERRTSGSGSHTQWPKEPKHLFDIPVCQGVTRHLRAASIHKKGSAPAFFAIDL